MVRTRSQKRRDEEQARKEGRPVPVDPDDEHDDDGRNIAAANGSAASRQKQFGKGLICTDLLYVVLIILFFAGLLALAVRYFGMAELSAAEWEEIRPPTTLENVQHLGTVLKDYCHMHFYRTLLTFGLCFLYVQSFFIPVSTLLNLLAGAWYGTFLGTFVCVFCTAWGSTNCYFISRYLGKRLVVYFLGERLDWVRSKVDEHKDDQFSYLTFFFVMPGPHTAMKVASPHIGIPPHVFFPCVFFGLIPYNLIVVRAGLILSTLKSRGDIFDWRNYVQLAVLAVVGILLPKLLAKRLMKKKKTGDGSEGEGEDKKKQ